MKTTKTEKSTIVLSNEEKNKINEAYKILNNFWVMMPTNSKMLSKDGRFEVKEDQLETMIYIMHAFKMITEPEKQIVIVTKEEINTEEKKDETDTTHENNT